MREVLHKDAEIEKKTSCTELIRVNGACLPADAARQAS